MSLFHGFGFQASNTSKSPQTRSSVVASQTDPNPDTPQLDRETPLVLLWGQVRFYRVYSSFRTGSLDNCNMATILCTISMVARRRPEFGGPGPAVDMSGRLHNVSVPRREDTRSAIPL